MLIEETNKYFPESEINSTNWKEKFLVATKYKNGFNVVEDCFMYGNLNEPNFPDIIQVFDEKIVHLYSCKMSRTLDWHTDDMILDTLSSGKYACLMEGQGVLEVKDDNGVESYEFKEKFRWVKFNSRKHHRFITNTTTIMIMSSTLKKEYIEKFYPGDTIYHGSGKYGAGYPELLREEEKNKMKNIIEKVKENKDSYEFLYS